jgi:Family of unknown function (DUF5706)
VTTKHTHQSGPAAPEDRGGEFGWHVHEALQAWTASVDAKASIVLVVEVALAGAAVHLLIGGEDELGRMGGLHLALSILALAALCLALASALGVVFPRLARRRSQAASPGLIYFGHLRGRTPAGVAQGLAGLDAASERHELASQLQITAQIAWRKHGWLQASLALLVLGSVALAASLLLFPHSTEPNRHQFVPYSNAHPVLVSWHHGVLSTTRRTERSGSPIQEPLIAKNHPHLGPVGV